MEWFGSHKPSVQATLISLLLLCLLAPVANAQEQEFEEIVVSFEVQRLLKQDLFVQYNGTTVFVPVIELLTILDLNVDADFTAKTISGFILTEKSGYHIDLTSLLVETSTGEYHLLPSEFFATDRELYLRVDLMEKIFDLKAVFDFSLLAITMPLNEDFPAYQRLKRKSMRLKLQEKKEELRDVRELPATRPYINGGSLDWTLGTNPLDKDGQYYNIDAGGMVLGGDTYLSMAGRTRNKFDKDQLSYRWHYFADHSRYLTQVELGHFYTSGALGRRFEGGMITNRPQVRRKFFETINLTGHVGENWEVELWVDHRLTDFVTTDARGEYNFILDVYYGSSIIELKFYGPNGEIRTEEQFVRIPHNLIPKNEFEYTVAAGWSKSHQEKRPYAQSTVYYGVLDRLTIGLGADQPIGSEENRVVKEQTGFATEVVAQPITNLTLTGSFSPSNNLTANFNFNQPSLINASGSFTKYFENDVRNPLGQKIRAQLALSIPVQIKGRHIGLRYYVSMDQFDYYRTINMNYGFAGSTSFLHVNYIGRYKVSRFANRTTSSTSSQLLLSPKLVRWLRPQLRLDYNHTLNSVERYGIYLNRRLFRNGQLTLSYERNVPASVNTFMITFNFLASFAQVTSRAMHSAGHSSMTQVTRGSIQYNQTNRSFLFDRRNAVGYGTAVVRPFLDLNYNGYRDIGEEELAGLRANISGISGNPRGTGSDRVFYYERLRPYDPYLVKIDEYSLDDPMLKPTNENYQVTVNPNMVTSIDVPLVIASELSGAVKRRTEYGDVGIGGIKMIVVNVSKDILSEISTFTDGEYYYLGLLPGSYRVYPDPAQLQKYSYRAEPEFIEFEVEAIEGGTAVQNINFTLLPLP